MYTEVRLKYYHPGFNIGMADLKSAWLLTDEPVALIVTVYRGNLTYRVPKTRKRISYRNRNRDWSKPIVQLCSQ